MTTFNFALASLGAVCTASNQQSGHPGALLIDGNDVTFWQNSAPNPTLTVDLGAPQYITLVRLLQGNPTSGYCTNPILRWSTDGSTWFDLTQLAGVYGWNDWNTGGICARYWRIAIGTMAGGYCIGQSFQIWGPVEAPPPPVSPAPVYIQLWLDGIEANYVPTIDEWLAAH